MRETIKIINQAQQAAPYARKYQTNHVIQTGQMAL